MSAWRATFLGRPHFNPIVIKEMRQAVRSRIVMAAVLLFPFVLLIVSSSLLMTANLRAMAAGNEISMSRGRDLFQAYFILLSFGALVGVPLYTGIRLAQELSGGQMDLLFITTIKPGAIIRGKLVTGLAVAGQLFSLCVPFMALTYLLRGIDLFTIFYLLSALFLFIAAATTVAILIACLPHVHFGFKNVLLVGGALVSAFFTMIYTVDFHFSRGLSGRLVTWDFWSGALTVGAALLAGIVLVSVMATALLMPPAANRALMVRLTVTVVWLLGSLLAAVWTFSNHDADGMIGWGWVSVFLLGGALLAVISEPDQLSRRVRLTIPRRAFARAVAFLFFNGPAGGLIWCGMLMALTLCLVGGATKLYASSPLAFRPTQYLQIFVQYLMAIGWLALLLSRTLFARRLPPHLAWTVAGALWGLAGIMPIVFNLMLPESRQFDAFFAFDRDPIRFQHLMVSGGVAAAGWLCALPWMIRQFRQFRRPQEGE